MIARGVGVSGKPLHGRRAVVTGASSGIGAAIARDLAGRGAGLVLIARRTEKLERLAAELRAAYAVEIETRTADLGDEAERARLGEVLERADMLVNNAGLGVHAHVADADWAALRQLLDVNILALTHLTRLALPGMRARGWGRILQIASVAGFQPVPAFAAYGASKAYVVSFGVALAHELAGSGVTCTTLCPGATRTEFFDVAAYRPSRAVRSTMMSGEDVARMGVDGMLRGRGLVVAGAVNRLTAFAGRITPPVLAARLAARIG